MPVPHCIGCGTTQQSWWWWCAEHRVWECESCSQPGVYRSAEKGTHRFSCEIEGVKQLGNRLLVTCTSDRYDGPDGDVSVETLVEEPVAGQVPGQVPGQVAAPVEAVPAF